MNKLLIASAIVGAILMVRQVSNLSPRGMRLNNPGNIKEFHSKYIDWVGEHPVDLDPVFEEFERPEYGIRALGRILDNYWSKHGIETVRDLVHRFAPGADANDTEAYIADVSQRVGVFPDQPLTLDHWKLDLVKAIVIHEQGYNPYSDDFYLNALRLA